MSKKKAQTPEPTQTPAQPQKPEAPDPEQAPPYQAGISLQSALKVTPAQPQTGPYEARNATTEDLLADQRTLNRALNDEIIRLRGIKEAQAQELLLKADLVDRQWSAIAAREAEVKEAKDAARTARKPLPDERPMVGHKFDLAGHHGFIHVGCYPDSGRIGEIFVEMSRDGGTIGGLLKSLGRSVSVALQYGAAVEDLCHKFAGTRFEPAGFSAHPEIGYAKSIVDYLFRWLAWQFEITPEHGQGKGFTFGGWVAIGQGGGDQKTEDAAMTESEHLARVEAARATSPVGLWYRQQHERAMGVDMGKAPSYSVQTQIPTPRKPGRTGSGPPCSECGTLTVPAGKCHCCPQCGQTTGCS